MQNILELKARAYDILAQIEWLNAELKKTNEAIVKAMEEEKEKKQTSE
jgi:hypothetical protein